MTKRLLKPHELVVFNTMLSAGKSSVRALLDELDSALVVEMNDGGMGSLKFCWEDGEPTKMAESIAEGEFTDRDGVPVSVEINIDEQGRLFELDMWKVDFSPLRQWPKAIEISVREQL